MILRSVSFTVAMIHSQTVSDYSGVRRDEMKSLILTFSLSFSLALFYGQLSFGQSSSTELQPKGANSESKPLPATDAIAKTPNAAASMPGAAGNGTALSGKKLNARPAKTGTAKPQGGAISRTVGATTSNGENCGNAADHSLESLLSSGGIGG